MAEAVDRSGLRAKFVVELRAVVPGLEDSDDVSDSRRLEELGVDSLLRVEMLVRLEEALGLSFQDEDLVPSTFESVGSLWGAAVRASEASSAAS